MAQGKQAERKLTPEEKLQRALIPAEEQPYEVPENWCWVRLSALSRIISKGTTPTGGKDAYVSAGVNFVRVENLNDDGTISHEHIAHIAESIHTGFLKRSILQENDVLISIAGTLGKTGIVRNIDLPLNTNQALAFVRILSQNLSAKYIKNVIDSTIIQQILLEKTKVTSIPNLTLEIIGNCPIPLPPLPEQHRIVARIESLFAKLDEAKEKAQTVVDGFELRKSAILHKAFTGQLTARWRKEHGVGLDSWGHSPWGNFIISIEAGKNWSAEGRPPKDSEFGVVKVSAVTWGEFNELESKTCTSDDQWNEKTQIRTGDFLFSRANTLELVGNCVIVKTVSKRLMLSDKILRLCFDKSILPEYILYFTRSALYRGQVKQLASGNQDGMRNISQKNMKLVKFPIPLLREQEEIVRILDTIFAKEQQAKEAAEAVLDQIDTMKKAILARAFRGELGTNDPTENWAKNLIKTVL